MTMRTPSRIRSCAERAASSGRRSATCGVGPSGCADSSLSDRLLRFVEDLDAVRDRAAVTQEELSARLAESMNRTMYVLSIVTAIFLPLGLLTGLLGVNVGGMPGEESEQAFAYVCVLMGVMALGLWALFRSKRLV